MNAKIANRLAKGRPELGGRPSNNLLATMRSQDYALIASDLEAQNRSTADLLYDPGDSVEFVYFPCGPALASFLVCNEDGRDSETVLVGREGAAGGIVSAGRLPAYCKITVKYPGQFMRLRTEVLQEAKANSKTMRNLFTRYADCLLAQVFQSVSCNAVHTVEQRAAKWIIAAMERTGDHNVPLTQEELASILGVGRSYANRVMRTLSSEGILSWRRGNLQVVSPERLARRACLCNEAVKRHFETVLEGVYPDENDEKFTAA